jgi:hypothetical protein
MMLPIDIAQPGASGPGTMRADARRNHEAIVSAARELFAEKGMVAERAAEAVDMASQGEPWEAFRGFIEWSAALQAGDRALSEAMASRSERMHAAAVASGLVPQLELLLDLVKRAGALREDLVVEDIPAMVCSVGSVAVAAAEKPGWRWDRVLAIWLDGVRAPGVTALPPLEPPQAQRRRAP